MKSLLDSMRIEHHRDSTIQDEGRPDDEFHGRVWVASDLDPLIGLEMQAGFGDAYHAMEPFIWVDRGSDQRKVVYVEGQSHEGEFGQLAFAERAGFLLIIAEYTGAYPAVVDMRSGRVLLRTNLRSARAVWAHPPRGRPR
jgi:hypothetical protein